MQIFPRGAGVTIAARFQDAAGKPATPRAAAAWLHFRRRDGVAAKERVPLILAADGAWRAQWDSGVAASGPVHGHVCTRGDHVVAHDFSFLLSANAANP